MTKYMLKINLTPGLYYIHKASFKAKAFTSEHLALQMKHYNDFVVLTNIHGDCYPTLRYCLSKTTELLLLYGAKECLSDDSYAYLSKFARSCRIIVDYRYNDRFKSVAVTDTEYGARIDEE